jgi:glutathione S-transferase
MIELYHSLNARSLRALWMLEELGLPYKLHNIAFPPRHLHQGYLDLNPLGTVPLLIDGETRMTESSAIIHYLGTRYGPSDLIVQPDEAAYGAYLNFLFMGEATLTFPQTIFLRYTFMEPEERRLPQAAADYTQWFLSRLKGAAVLMGQDYVCANRFTAADISIAYALHLAKVFGLAQYAAPETMAYYARVAARPAFQRALSAERAQAP